MLGQGLGGVDHAAREQPAAHLAVAVVVLVVLGVALGEVGVADLVELAHVPVHGLAGTVGVLLLQGDAGTVVVDGVHLVHVLGDAHLGGLFLHHAGAQHALGERDLLLLQHGDLGAGLGGSQGGGHARGAGAHDHHIVVLLLGEVGDGVDHDGGRLELGGQDAAGKLGGGDGGALLGQRDAGAGGQAGGCGPGKLEDVAAGCVHAHGGFLSSGRPVWRPAVCGTFRTLRRALRKPPGRTRRRAVVSGNPPV